MTAVKHVLATLILTAAFAAPVAAQTFTPPRGCTLTLTTQLRQCQVVNHYTCAGDAPGDRWISYADGQGVFFTTRIDFETRWMESIDHETGVVDALLPKAADHASFSTLLATGRDDYDFMTESSEGVVERFVGVDTLTGASVMIDGFVLDRSEFDLSSYDAAGNFVSRRAGTQLVSRDLRLFFGDTEVFENADGERFESFQPPVTFALPGEDGFGALKPKFDCDAVLTGTLPRGGA
jgi:hypothetical protein